MEIGISSFVETTPIYGTGQTISHAERLRQVVEEIKLADAVGLDVYGVGEHHREDYAASAPAVLLAAAATQTKRIRLTSAVSVISSDDPVRIFQEFSTLDGLSNGRAEIMAGRGSFIESFPLFGYDLNDYNELFEEKLDLLLKLQNNEFINWRGHFRPDIQNLGIYPRPVQEKLPVWIATGGTPQSSIRAGQLGLPVVFAIIGGSPLYFTRLAEMYVQAGLKAGFNQSELKIASHSHGFIAKTEQEVIDKFYPSIADVMTKLGKERGWGAYTRETFDAARSQDGALFAGDVETVAKKIIDLRKNVGVTRFFLHLPVGSMPHEDVMEAIRLLGEEVAPIVRKEVARWEAEQSL